MATDTSPSPLPTLIQTLQFHTRTPEEGLRLLQVYQRFVRYGNSLKENSSNPLVRYREIFIRQEWLDLLRWLHAQHPDTHTLGELPSHQEVIDELIRSIPYEDSVAELTLDPDYVICFGGQTGFTTMTLLEHGGFRELLDYIGNLQPQYWGRIIEYEERIALHRDPRMFLILALRRHIDTTDLEKIKNTLSVFTEITVRAAAFLRFLNFKLTEEKILHFCKFAIMWVRSVVSQPFSNMALDLRCHLASLDISVLVRTLLHQALYIARATSVRQELAWRLHHWMAHCVKTAFAPGAGCHLLDVQIFHAVSEVMRSPFRWQGFFSADPMPLANFLPHGWRRNASYKFQWEVLYTPPLIAAAPRVMQDVTREPVSPPQSPLICSTPVGTADEIEPGTDCTICGEPLALLRRPDSQMAMRVHCDGGHIYHYDCLSTLINGIDAYANKCPVCRQEICSLRRSKPIIDEVD